MDFNWAEEYKGAITVCDEHFIIVYMNVYSKQQFAKYGGGKLIGQNLLECHNDNSSKLIRKILREGKSHSYTRQTKDGRTKVIQQSPWIESQSIKGVVEISFYLERIDE